MSISDWLMVLAVLFAPFLAIFAQKQIDLWREKRQRKLWVFKTLMATRGRPVSPEHVQALNMIDLEFTDSGDAQVLTAWKEYRDHLNSYPREGESQAERRVVWLERTYRLLATLLQRMGRRLNYRFDSVQIRRDAYAPQAHADSELELQVIRRWLLEWLAGDRHVSITVVPKDEASEKQGDLLLSNLTKLVEGTTPLKVELSPTQAENAPAENARPARVDGS